VIEIDPPTGSAEKDKGTSRRKSHDPPTRDEEKDQGTSRRSSLEQIPMEVDHNLAGDKYFDVFDNDNQHEPEVLITKPPYRQPLINRSVSRTYLTKEEFNYTMNLLDTKISSLYTLCRYISDKQQEDSKALKKLVALDDLSNDFWNVSYLMNLAVLF
jgi:hypothetical protein